MSKWSRLIALRQGDLIGCVTLCPKNRNCHYDRPKAKWPCAMWVVAMRADPSVRSQRQMILTASAHAHGVLDTLLLCTIRPHIRKPKTVLGPDECSSVEVGRHTQITQSVHAVKNSMPELGCIFLQQARKDPARSLYGGCSATSHGFLHIAHHGLADNTKTLCASCPPRLKTNVCLKRHGCRECNRWLSDQE